MNAIADDEYEFGEEPNWRGHEPSASEHDQISSVHSLMNNIKVRNICYEILMPFAHDPKNMYVAGKIYEGAGRSWYIEGQDFEKFKNAEEAIIKLCYQVEAERTRMLNEAFKNSGI